MIYRMFDGVEIDVTRVVHVGPINEKSVAPYFRVALRNPRQKLKITWDTPPQLDPMGWGRAFPPGTKPTRENTQSARHTFEARYNGLLQSWYCSGGVVDRWLPIFFAPKDGTEILGCTDDGHRAVIYFDDEQWRSDAGANHRFTVWRPLPIEYTKEP